MSSTMEPLIDTIIVSSLNAGADCIQVYDGTTGTQLKSYRGLPAAPSTLCLVGHGAYLMAARRDKPFLQAWPIHRHEALQIRLVVPGRVNAMAVSSTGSKYCIIGISEKLYVYKLLSGRLIGVASRHYQPITRLVFTPCGNYFASGGEDGFVYLWSLASFIEALHKYDAPQVQPHFILGQHSDKVTDLAMTSFGIRGFLVSSSLDHTARVFDLVTGRPMYNLVTSGGVTSVACNTLGSQLFLGHNDGTVNIVNLLPAPPHGDVQVTSRGVECHQKAVKCLAVTTSGNQLVTGGDDGEVKVWSVISGGQGTLGSNKVNDSHIALQRVVHMGRGPVTNLSIVRTERETLTTAELDIKEVIAPFSQDHSSPLAVPTIVPIRGRGKQHLQELDLINFTPELSVQQNAISEGISGTNDDLQSSINQLQTANTQLFKFALRHIIDEERDL
ncbi:WD repeat-containing protein 18 isoform X2 [Procambarus clarkii]|nr:WD repeat-containing protein 18-like isoform X2 [Procambarus clarkii]XP_045609757.1 WD repeat-containing protein 18-like isoform X2 [Procambarus clarkii]XP_045609758.1 WD repeat-containing protein 18-like isoform X2 [Procambarus clarkii]